MPMMTKMICLSQHHERMQNGTVLVAPIIKTNVVIKEKLTYFSVLAIIILKEILKLVTLVTVLAIPIFTDGNIQG